MTMMVAAGLAVIGGELPQAGGDWREVLGAAGWS